MKLAKTCCLFVGVSLLSTAISGIAFAVPKRNAEAALPTQPALANLSGQAFFQTTSGLPRTCAGQDDVLVIPETDSAAVSSFFTNSSKGFVPNGETSFIAPNDAKIAGCDATGNFTAANLQPGGYFVVSHIQWMAGKQGGWLMKRVDLAPGDAQKTILSASVEDAPPPPEQPKRDPREVVAEQVIRGRLLDPASANFEWPGRWNENQDFKFWRWSKSIHGDWTCGKVNAHNRMGGYVGQSYFLVIVDGGSVADLSLDTEPSEFSLITLKCQKAGF